MKKPFGFLSTLCLAAAALPAVAAGQQPAPAPAAPAMPLSAGMKVYDSTGEEVGTIAQVSGDKVAVAVGNNGIVVPANAFVKTDKGPALQVTKAKLVAAVEKATKENAAALNAALKVGADVRSAGGSTVLGQVKAVDAGTAVLGTSAGDVTMPRSAFFVTPVGLAANMSAAQFAQAVQKSKAAPTP